MKGLFFLLVLALVWRYLADKHRKQTAQQHAQLVEFARTLERGEVEGLPGFWRGFRGIAVHGVRNGFRRRLFFSKHSDRLHYELVIPEPLAELSFEITPATLLSRFASFAWSRTGDAALDRDFRFQAEGAALERLTQLSHLHEALSFLFSDAGISGIKLDLGRLRASQPIRAADDGLLQPARLELVFSVLEGLAQACARVQVTLQERSVYGWTGGAESVRCPFCRDDLGDALEACEACPHCATLHHTECLAEAGGCTIFGCQGAPAQVPA